MSTDTRIRDLERQAATGDMDAREQLRQELLRSGKVDEALEVLVKGGFLDYGSCLEIKKGRVDMVLVKHAFSSPEPGLVHLDSVTLGGRLGLTIRNASGERYSFTVLAAQLPDKEPEGRWEAVYDTEQIK